MQTSILEKFKNTAEGREADAILRSCVHCGFCTATCPTYQLLGDELDSPRGRIYLIKQVLEGQACTHRTQMHLDRCLTCRACETTCPSGVRYGRLVDIGRHLVEQRVHRPFSQRLLRDTLRRIIPHPRRLSALVRLGRAVAPLLPSGLRAKLPRPQPAHPWPQARHTRSMLILDACAQSTVTPNTNAAAARVLDRLGIGLERVSKSGCCGAVSHHLSAHSEALNFARRNIDAWWPQLEAGAEAIVATASGCGVMLKDYGDLLQHDAEYADKARTVSARVKDIAEVLANEDLSAHLIRKPRPPIAFHSPCTLQHGQKLDGLVESILEQVGFQLLPVPDAHLCCGSAGTYSITQPELSQRLLQNKLQALQSGSPTVIATANIGCLMHLESQAQVPVRHWVELVDEALGV